VNALVNGEMLAILFRLQDIVAVRASERKRPSNLRAAREHASADFAQEGTPPAGVVVYVLVWGVAAKANSGLWNRILATPGDGLDFAAVLPEIIFLQKPPVLLLKLPDNGEHVGLKLLVSGRVQVIKGKLAERDVSRDEAD